MSRNTLLRIIALASLLAPIASARAQEPPAAVAKPAKPDFADCITQEERDIAAQENKNAAFGRSVVPLMPLLYMSRDRTFTEAMLLYWSSINIEQGSRMRLLIPFFLQTCTRESRTLVTPLFGSRDDAEGTAGFVGPYFYRRDKHAQSDVLFPLFFRIVDPEHSTFALLNFYTHTGKQGSSGGLIPFAFWGDQKDGSHYTFVPPLFWRWGDNETSTTVALNVYSRSHLKTLDWDVGAVPFYFGARHADKYYDFVLPPLYWQWGDKDEHTSIGLLPPGYYHKRHQRWDAGAVPFYFGGRDGAGYYDVVPPLLFADWGDPKDHGVWFINNYYHSYPEGWTYVFFPFYFGSHKTDGSFYDIGFPAYWRFGDRQSDFGLALQTYWKTSPTGWDAGSVPFYFGGRAQNGYHYQAILPPLYVNWGDSSTDHTLVLNTYLGQDHKTGDYDFAFFPLAYAGKHGPAKMVLSPLYAHWSDAQQQTTIVPLGYHHEDKEGSDWGAIPFVFHGSRATGDHYTLIPPLLYFNYGDSTESLTWALTAYYYQDPEKTRWGAFPFIFRGVAGDDRYLLIPPLLTFDVRDKDHATTIVLNTFYRRGLKNGEGDPDDYDFGFAPLYFQGRHHGRRYNVFPFFPFWYDHGPDSSLLIVGPFYRNVEGQDWDAGFVPFYFGGRNKGKSYNLVPLALTFDFGDEAQGERTTIFPLGYRHRTPHGSDFGLFPFYFDHSRGKEHFWTVPLALTAHWGDALTENTISTLYYSFAGPGYEHQGFAPLYASGEYDKGEKGGSTKYRLVLPPLYEHYESPQSDTSVLLQTWIHSRKAGGWDAGSFPFYFGGRRPDGEFYDVVLPPLYASWGDRTEHTTIATLFYDRETAGGRDFGFAPLYFGGRQHGGEGFYYDVALPPLFARWGDDHRNTMWAGPLYHSRNGERRHYGLFPLYYGGRGTGDKGDGYYDHVLPPLFMRWGDSTTHTTVAFPGYYSESPDGYHLGLFPLLFMGRHEDSQRHYTFVPPLYWRWGSSASDTTLVLPFGWHKRSVGGSSTALIPFYFGGEDGPDYYRMVLPPLYMSWGDAAQDTTVALLYFNRRKPNGFSRGVLPFYMDAREDDRWFRMITPLFYQWGDFDSEKALLFPLAYYEKQGAESLFLSPLVVSHSNSDTQKKQLVVFPFWWQFKGPESDVNVGFPLWWDFTWHDEGSRLSILAPLGFHYEKPDEATTMVLNTLYSHGKGKNAAAWSFHFFPLLSLEKYNPDHFKWQFLLGLVGRERQDDQTRWRVVYFWTNPS